jgi:hypothetical protein
MHSRSTVSAVLELVGEGHNSCEISRRTGVPRSTVRGWRQGQVPKRTPRVCDLCAGRPPQLPEPEYAYLLGLYLGDGCISPHPRTYRMRIVLDSMYPQIIEDCAVSLRAVCPEKSPWVGAHGRGCVAVSMYWNHWPCLFPQHGSGKKHLRPIVLSPWQCTLVERNRRQLIRGLIHSDGCRVVANDRGLMSVRYHFSNLSSDIKQIYCDSLDALGIRWTRPCDREIAVYRKSAVAVMDQFVGPKE